MFALGLACLISGIALSITSALGVGSWQVFETGLVEVSGAGFGTVILVEALICGALAWVWLDQPPWIATGVLAFAGTGIGAMVEALETPEAMAPRVAMFAAGTVLIAVGVAFYLAADLGASAQDALFVGLYTRYRWRPGAVRFGMDAALVVAGIALGGQFGVGTFVVTVAVPVLIEPALRVGHRLAGTPLPPSMQTPDTSILSG